MKNLVVTKYIGDCPKHSLKIHEKYCEKYNLDLHVIDKYKLNYKAIGYESFQALEFLNNYDRILYIDGDVLITPHAPNIFEFFPDPKPFYAFHESGYSYNNNRDPLVIEILKCLSDKFIIWPKEWNGRYRYFNTGIFMFSKHHEEYLNRFKEIDEKTGILPMDEQTCLNALVTSFGIPFKNIHWEWNRGDMDAPDPNLMRLRANFIHYSGRGYAFYTRNGKYDILKSDLEFLYPEYSSSESILELQQFDLLYK